ncbi:MAG: N-formylglutamate amidohydrolase [Pseudomonadota bacterium]
MKPFSIEKPKTDHTLPLIFDSPHSGARYPDDFNYACDFKTLEAAEDKYVDELFENAPNHGITFLHAHFPRSYIDVNRDAADIDEDLLDEDWSGPFKINPTSRSHAGIGLIRRLVKPGIPVYDRALTPEEIVARIEKYYRPYHDALEELIRDAHYNFGQAWHINCHSMPSASAYPKRGIGLVGNRARAVDFCLGDRDGRSCSLDFTHALKNFIKSLGYTVSVNDPFKGVELIEKHSSPAQGYHSLQIEINKSLYMDENTGEKTKDFALLKDNIDEINHFCAEFVQSRLTQLAAD